jgi:hypothetical protein
MDSLMNKPVNKIKDRPMTDKFTHPNDAPEGHQWVVKGGFFDGKQASSVMHIPAYTPCCGWLTASA